MWYERNSDAQGSLSCGDSQHMVPSLGKHESSCHCHPFHCMRNVRNREHLMLTTLKLFEAMCPSQKSHQQVYSTAGRQDVLQRYRKTSYVDAHSSSKEASVSRKRREERRKFHLHVERIPFPLDSRNGLRSACPSPSIPIDEL
jgi:hypothetical protein